ncbi:hypothetical protein R1sor_020883 [Riccia sorocarpa]|uniref:Uncharacterized protein n=1 Tax=Riccia sorocarpa TaxID=122646 RepID=A0ABD3GFG3_9MARC
MLVAQCQFALPCPIKSLQNVPLSNRVSAETRISKSLSRAAVASGSNVSSTGTSVRASCTHNRNGEDGSSFSRYRTDERRSVADRNSNSSSRPDAANIPASFSRENSSCFSAVDGRRRFLSMVSGAALLSLLERNSGAVAADGASGLINSSVGTSEGPAPDAPAEGNALIRKLLERSKANKEKNDKARLDDYYRRNFKEYFEFIEGTVQRKKPEDLTEAERGIIEWLKKNR